MIGSPLRMSNITNTRERSFDESSVLSSEFSMANLPDVDKELYVQHLPNNFNFAYVTRMNAEEC